MKLFGKSKIEKKMDKVNSLWESAVNGVSAKIEKEVFVLLQDIIAEKPSNDAKMMLADCYTFGIGCEKNLSIAKKLYLEISQDSNFSESFKILGDMAYNDKEGTAFEYYQNYLKVNPNDNEVYSHLADCYYNGLGTIKNIEVAMAMYKKVASTDYANTTTFQIRYGTILDEQEREETIMWLSKAADNDSWASYLLASVLKNACYLPFNTYTPEYRIETALFFYEKAFSLASAEKDTKLSRLAENSYNLFRAELNTNDFTFHFQTEERKGNYEQILLNERVNELLEQAREAKKNESYSLAQRFYNAVLDIVPSNWEANMYLSIIDKMQIDCSESDIAIRTVRNSLSKVAEIIADNVQNEKEREYYCLDIAATAVKFAFYICHLQYEEFDRLVMQRTPFNRLSPVRFSKEHIHPRYHALSEMLYSLANDLKHSFPNGEGKDGASIANDAAQTISKLN